jgi:hypothetical protein
VLVLVLVLVLVNRPWASCLRPTIPRRIPPLHELPVWLPSPKSGTRCKRGGRGDFGRRSDLWRSVLWVVVVDGIGVVHVKVSSEWHRRGLYRGSYTSSRPFQPYFLGGQHIYNKTVIIIASRRPLLISPGWSAICARMRRKQPKMGINISKISLSKRLPIGSCHVARDEWGAATGECLYYYIIIDFRHQPSLKTPKTPYSIVRNRTLFFIASLSTDD